MKTFQGFQVFDFKYRAKSKTRKPRNWAFFLLKPHHTVNFLFWIIFQSIFRFWVPYTTKNLSKRKLSDISEFSILGIRQNRTLGILGNWHFSLHKPHEKVNVFFFGVIFQSVFRLWVSYNTKHLSKRKLSEISRVFDFGYRANSKTRKLRKLEFFITKPHRNVIDSFFLGIF